MPFDVIAIPPQDRQGEENKRLKTVDTFADALDLKRELLSRNVAQIKYALDCETAMAEKLLSWDFIIK